MPSPDLKMIVDLERCTGCHACSVACKTEHDVPLGFFRLLVHYRDQGSFPKVRRDFLPALCVQCSDAPCLKACPTGAIKKGADGVVTIDAATCDAHAACVTACPFGAIFVEPATKKADKCDFCANRRAHGLEPACVETCPAEVLVFGDAADPHSKVARLLKSDAALLSPLKPGKVPGQQVLYRKLDRTLAAKVPEGRPYDPKSYEIESW
jgi:tetrathionate reductase subunit B